MKNWFKSVLLRILNLYRYGTFDSWEPDLEGEGSEDPQYIQMPIVIIDDRYQLKLERNWQYDM